MKQTHVSIKDLFGLFSWGDALAVALSLLVIALFTLYSSETAGNKLNVVIETDRGTYIYPLQEDRLISVAGPLGTSVIQIKNGQVAFMDSPCRDKLCLQAKPLSQNGQWTACLPNKVIVAINGQEETIDAVVY